MKQWNRYDVFDETEKKYVLNNVTAQVISDKYGIKSKHIAGYVKKGIKINKRYTVIPSDTDEDGQTIVKYKLWDNTEKRYILEDTPLSNIMKNLGIAQSTVEYALCHGNLICGRYLVTEDFIQNEQLDEWDQCCKELRERFGPAVLSQISLVGVSSE